MKATSPPFQTLKVEEMAVGLGAVGEQEGERMEEEEVAGGWTEEKGEYLEESLSIFFSFSTRNWFPLFVAVLLPCLFFVFCAV